MQKPPMEQPRPGSLGPMTVAQPVTSSPPTTYAVPCNTLPADRIESAHNVSRAPAPKPVTHRVGSSGLSDEKGSHKHGTQSSSMSQASVARKYRMDDKALTEAMPLQMAIKSTVSKDAHAKRIDHLNKYHERALRYAALPDDAWVPLDMAPPDATLTVTAQLAAEHQSLGASVFCTTVPIPYSVVASAVMSPVSVTEWHVFMRQHAILEIAEEYWVTYTSYTEIDREHHSDMVSMQKTYRLGGIMDGSGLLLVGCDHPDAPERSDYCRIRTILMYFEFIPVGNHSTQVKFLIERYQVEEGIMGGLGLSVVGLKVPLFFYFFRQYLLNLAVVDESIVKFLRAARNLARTTIFQFRASPQQLCIWTDGHSYLYRRLEPERASPPIVAKSSCIVDAPVMAVKECMMALEWCSLFQNGRVVDEVDCTTRVVYVELVMLGKVFPVTLLVCIHEITQYSFSATLVSIEANEPATHLCRPIVLPSSLYVHSINPSQTFALMCISVDSSYFLEQPSQNVSNATLQETFVPVLNVLTTELSVLKQMCTAQYRKRGNFITNETHASQVAASTQKRESLLVSTIVNQHNEIQRLQAQLGQMKRRQQKFAPSGEAVPDSSQARPVVLPSKPMLGVTDMLLEGPGAPSAQSFHATSGENGVSTESKRKRASASRGAADTNGTASAMSAAMEGGDVEESTATKQRKVATGGAASSSKARTGNSRASRAAVVKSKH